VVKDCFANTLFCTLILDYNSKTLSNDELCNIRSCDILYWFVKILYFYRTFVLKAKNFEILHWFLAINLFPYISSSDTTIEIKIVLSKYLWQCNPESIKNF